MAKNYKDYNYFETRPEIVKIFDDLDALKDFCRMEMIPYDESFLYNRESWVWRKFDKVRKGKTTAPSNRPYNSRKPRFEKTFH